MKGIVMSSALLMFLMSLVFSIVLYISFESDRFQIHQALKNALRSTMIHCLEHRCDESQAFALFAENLDWIAEGFRGVQVDLMGFHDDPLLIRIRVSAKGGMFDMFDIVCDETMIEEGLDEET